MTWIISTSQGPLMYWYTGDTPWQAGASWLHAFFPQHDRKQAMVKEKGHVADFAIEDLRFRVRRVSV